MNINQSVIKKILLIKLRGIGDVILSTIVLENLKNNFPNAEIDYLTEKPSEQLISGLREIDSVYLFSDKSLTGRLNLIKEIRKEKYDLILDFYSNPFTAQVTFTSGAKYRAGYPLKGRKYAYNLFGPKERGKYHAADLHLEFLKMLGIEVINQNLKCDFGNDAKSFAKKYVEENISNEKLLLGISPSGGWASKKCDPVKFAEIADAAAEKYDCNVLVVWGPGDEKECDEIISKTKCNSVKAPATNIRQMAALISECDFLIANDSGPMHISTAVGTPTLSLHGPTDPKLQGPYGNKHEWINKSDLHCIICNLLECPYNHECFMELKIEDVLERIDSLLNKNGLIN